MAGSRRIKSVALGGRRLLRAATDGNLAETLRWLSKETAQEVDLFGMTPMMQAARAGRAQCVRALLPLSDPLAKALSGRSAAISAVLGGSAECVALLAPLSDMELVDNDGYTALTWAAALGNAECLAAALPFADPKRAPEMGFTALMVAAKFGHAECVRLLLPASDVAAVDEFGRSALGVASRRGPDDASNVAQLIRAYMLMDAERGAMEAEVRASHRKERAKRM